MKYISIKKTILLFCFLVLCTSCASPATSAPPFTSEPSRTPTMLPTIDEARGILSQFFDLLNAKQYPTADTLYGGDYEQLKVFSTAVDPTDHAKLWANACELAGLQCLKVRSAAFRNQQGDIYVFQVEFSSSDGNLFVLGPCCGSNETEMPPVSQFEYKVSRNNQGKFVVMDLPPYVP